MRSVDEGSGWNRSVRLPGRPTTTNQSVGDVIRTFQTYEETVLMLAREIDKLRASISGR
jgi:hypothetical protein